MALLPDNAFSFVKAISSSVSEIRYKAMTEYNHDTYGEHIDRATAIQDGGLYSVAKYGTMERRSDTPGAFYSSSNKCWTSLPSPRLSGQPAARGLGHNVV